MNHHDQEPTTEPIPRRIEHPQAINVAAVRQKVAEVAMEKVSGYDTNPTERIEVRIEPTPTIEISLTPVQEIDRQKKNQKTNWLTTIEEVNGQDR